MRPRAVLAPSGHATVDETRVARAALGRTDPEPLGDPRAEAFDEHVGAFDEVEHLGMLRRVLQVRVDDDAVTQDMGGGLVGPRAGPHHPQHGGTQVAEQHRRVRSRADASQFEYLDARECAVHVSAGPRDHDR